jgi:hypothetical protein
MPFLLGKMQAKIKPDRYQKKAPPIGGAFFCIAGIFYYPFFSDSLALDFTMLILSSSLSFL